MSSNWDFLDKFVYKYYNNDTVYILTVDGGDFGVTKWFLKNIKNSKLYLMSDIDEKQKNKINNNNIIKINGELFKELTKLNEKYVDMFDIIYINRINDITELSLIVWPLVMHNGILIINNYQQNKIEVDSFKTFISPTLKRLYINDSKNKRKLEDILVIRRITTFIKPNSYVIYKKIVKKVETAYNKLLNKYININIPSHGTKINFNIVFDKIKDRDNRIFNLGVHRNSDPDNKITANNDYFEDIRKKYLFIKHLYDGSEMIIFKPSLLISPNSHDRKIHTIQIYAKYYKYIQSKRLNLQRDKITYIMQFFHINFRTTCFFEHLVNLFTNFKQVSDLTSDLTILNTSYQYDLTKHFHDKLELSNISKLIESLIYAYNIKVKNYTYYDISCTNTSSKNENLYMNEYIFFKNCKVNKLNLTNLTNLLNIAHDLREKIDILNFGYNDIFDNMGLLKTCSSIPSLFYSMLFCLIVQKRGGNAVIQIDLFSNNSSDDQIKNLSDLPVQILYILSKYYEIILIQSPKCNSFITTVSNIVLKKFKGISNKEVDELVNIAKEINVNIPMAGRNTNIISSGLRKELLITKPITEDQTNIFLFKLINNSIDNNFISKIIDFRNIRNKYYVDELDIILKMHNIYINLKGENGIDNINLEKLFMLRIFNKQLQYILNWFNNLFDNDSIIRFLNNFCYDHTLVFVDRYFAKYNTILANKQIEEPSNKKISFLFLTMNNLNQPAVWEKYFKGHEGKYTIYCHPSDYINKNHKELTDPILKDHVIPKIYKTEWGKTVDAVISLIGEAYNDKNNYKMILCSESCVPIKSFSEMYSYMLENDNSIIKEYKINKDAVEDRYVKSIKKSNIQFPLKYFKKHAANYALNRGDMKILLDTDKKYITFFNNMNNGDEHFLSLLWYYCDGNSIFNYTNKYIIYSDWEYSYRLTNKYQKLSNKYYTEYKNETNTNKKKILSHKMKETRNKLGEACSHPQVYDKMTPTLMKKIYNSGSFFARKFTQTSDIVNYLKFL